MHVNIQNSPTKYYHKIPFHLDKFDNQLPSRRGLSPHDNVFLVFETQFDLYQASYLELGMTS